MLHTSFLQCHQPGPCLGLFVLLGGLMISLVGCGYTLVGASSNPAAGRMTLAVEPFINRTRQPDLESYITEALRQALIQSLVFDLTAVATAPRHLQGMVRRFQELPVSFDAQDNALQYRIEATIGIRLVEEVSQETTLEREFSVWAEYLVSETGSVRQNVAAKEAAFLRLAQQFADQCTALLRLTLL